MELSISSLANKSIGYSSLVLKCEYHPTVPYNLLCGKAETNNEIVGNFCKRMKDVWVVAYENMKKAIFLQIKCYNK